MQQQVRLARLRERRAEGVDELVRELADEADGVGQQVVAPAQPPAARRRVERVEEAVAHADLRARQRVEQRRLAGVGVADERDGRQLRALALGAHRLARALDPLQPAAQRGDAVAREAAVGLDLRLARSAGADPGPPAAAPAPAPSRSRWVHSPRIRARLYSSCASSTWSLPSAEWAWPAKMSRMIAVRSTTGIPSASSRLRPWRGVSSSSHATTLASSALIAALSSSSLPGPTYVFGCGCSRCWTSARPWRRPAVRSSSSSSARASPLASTPIASAR